MIYTGPDVTIVVLSHNRRERLRSNLSRLREIRKPGVEVIVVDNFSIDHSRDMITAEFPEFSLIEAPANLGPPAGRNLGFREARGQYIISFDDDTIAPGELVTRTIDYFESDESVGCVACRLRELSSGMVPNQTSAAWVGNYWGAAHAFRAESLRAIGYLDERFLFGAEEIDSSLRMLEAGYRTRYAPDITVEFSAEEHDKGDYQRRVAYWIAGWGWFYFKHFPLRSAILFASRVWLIHSVSALRRGHLSPAFRGLVLFAEGRPVSCATDRWRQIPPLRSTSILRASPLTTTARLYDRSCPGFEGGTHRGGTLKRPRYPHCSSVDP